MWISIVTFLSLIRDNFTLTSLLLITKFCFNIGSSESTVKSFWHDLISLKVTFSLFGEMTCPPHPTPFSLNYGFGQRIVFPPSLFWYYSLVRGHDYSTLIPIVVVVSILIRSTIAFVLIIGRLITVLFIVPLIKIAVIVSFLILKPVIISYLILNAVMGCSRFLIAVIIFISSWILDN